MTPTITNTIFDELYRTHAARIRTVLSKYEHDEDEQEDLLQTVFMEVWRSRDTFKEQANISTWLIAIARNVGAMHVRERSHSPDLVPASSMTYVDTEDGPESWLDQHTVDYDDPESILIAQETEEVANDVADTLQGRELEVYRLHFTEYLTPREIASRLEVAEGTVRVVIHRIREKILKSL